MSKYRPRTDDPTVPTSIRVKQSWLEILEAHGENVSKYAREGIKARVDFHINGGLAALEEKVTECKALKEEMDLQISIYEHQIQQILQKTVEDAQRQQEGEIKVNAFIAEVQRLAPDIINNTQGTARYKIEYLAGVSPGPGMQDIARFFTDRRATPAADEIKDFLLKTD